MKKIFSFLTALLFSTGLMWGTAATLPVNYSFNDGKSSLPTGVTQSGLGGDYAAGNAPYRLKFDNDGDYIQIEVDAAAAAISIGIKEYATSGASIQIQGCTTASGTYTTIQTLSFSNGQNKTGSKTTSSEISSSYRFFRVRRNSGGNFGLGTLQITKAATTDPVITADPDTVNVGYEGATDVSIDLTYENLKAGYVAWAEVFEDEDCQTAASDPWVTDVTLEDPYETVTFNVAENPNQSERTLYLQISALDDDSKDTTVVIPIIQASAPVTLTAVELNKHAFSIEEKLTEQLSVTFTPNNATDKAVTWASTDTKVATVSATGLVTAVAPGTAKISVTSTTNNAITDTCVVTVTEHVVTPGKYSISLNKAFYGIATAGAISAEQSASQNDITVVSGCTSGASSKTYYDAGHIRYYADSYLHVSVPAGFKIDSIVFTAGGTWNGSISVNTGTYDNSKTTWTGNAQSVEFSFAAQNRVASISVKYTVAVPEVTINPTSWDFESVVASDAASKVFSVSGSNLEAGDLTLSAPAGYSVNPAKITLAAAGALAATNVTVSKNTETAGTYNGNLAISGCGLSSAVNVSLKMIVTAAVVNVTSVTLDKHAVTLEEDSTQTLVATVLPADATNKAVTWASTNTAVATVENGVVTAVAPGTAKISVTSDADETKTDTCVVTVTGADLILDFTSNTNWGFPTSKTVAEGSYTSGDYTVKVAGSTGNGFYFVSDDNCLLVGKQDAYLILPVLADTAIARVVTLAESTGSGSVKFNVYQGETAVSTEVTGCKENQAFVIYPKKKNVEHSIVITSAHNARFSKIKIWYGPQDKATALDNTDASVKAVKVLREGQIFILRGEKVYTVQGQLVK